MRLRFRQPAVHRLGARIGPDADQRMLQRRSHIILVHDRGNDRRLALVGDHEVDDRVARVLPHRLADRGQRHAFVLPEPGVEDRRHHHAVAAVRAVPLVFPGGGVRIVHVLLDPFARRRVPEPLDELLEPAFPRPERNAGVEAVRRARVRVLIRGHVEASRPRRLDAPQHLGHFSEVRPVSGFEMPDLRRNRGALGDREHFVERLEDASAFRALMREIHAAVPRGDLRELDDLVSRCEAIGHVLQRRAEPERALLHRLRDQLPHLLELGCRCGTVGFADHVVANAARAHQRGDVDRRPRSILEPLEVVGQRAPVLRDAEVRGRRRRFGDEPIVHRRDRRALAGHLGRDALHDLAGRAAVDEHVELRLAQQIDEPRRDDQVRGIDRRRAAGVADHADRRDAIFCDGDVAAEPGRAGAVDDAPVGDDEIVARSLRRRPGDRACRRGKCRASERKS